MKQLIECVPNISEGRDKAKINAIASVVETVEGVTLLNVDPGAATNRTVITFVGEPEPVIEAAFLLIQKAAELIDMSKQTGEHPRFGALETSFSWSASWLCTRQTCAPSYKSAACIWKFTISRGPSLTTQSSI